VAACAALPPPGASAADAANGRRAYLAAGCYACHGRAGQGGAYNYAAPPLAQTQLSPERFKAVVRTGPNEMPAFVQAVLSDSDLDDVYAFARALPGARPLKDVPLLDAEAPN
jgi:mono/diheme cytochrome c family protein